MDSEAGLDRIAKTLQITPIVGCINFYLIDNIEKMTTKNV